MRPINRSLADEAMDHIDHALGRPLDPMAETHRNHFATNGALADKFAASPFWMESARRSGDRMRFFHVTEAGCRALAEYLKAIGDKHRAFVIAYRGFERTVVATTASKARYSYFLDVSDCDCGLTFKAFCSRASVRVAS